MYEAYDTIDRHGKWQMQRVNAVGGKLLKAEQSFYIDIVGCVSGWEMMRVSGLRLMLDCDRAVQCVTGLDCDRAWLFNVYYGCCGSRGEW